MIEDKATEKWKERAKRLSLIVNMGADKSQPKTKDGRSHDKDKVNKKSKK